MYGVNSYVPRVLSLTPGVCHQSSIHVFKLAAAGNSSAFSPALKNNSKCISINRILIMGSICGFAILVGVCGNLCCLTLRWSVRFLSSVKPLIHVVQVCMQAGCSASFFPALPSGKEQPSQIWHAAMFGNQDRPIPASQPTKHRTVMKEVHSDRKNGAGWYEL